jgi:catechol 2,3-dioxygenase-like lactoylglutathione lyase family enzyme
LKIDHINIAAPMALLEEVRRFYSGALQLEEGPRPDFGIPGYWLYGDGCPLIHLIESEEHHPAARPHYLDHVAFEVDGMESYTKRLDDMGVAYKVNHIPEYKLSQVFCEDPCGIKVEANFRH